MDLRPSEKVRHKLTGAEVLVLEVGPKSKVVHVPGAGGLRAIEQEYLAKGMVRIRTADMVIHDVYDYELEGIGYEGDPQLLMEKG